RAVEARVRRLLPVLILLTALLVPLRARAEAPDYAVPAGFVFPWTCGQSYRISWEPQGHWEFGKATGIAWDLSLTEGTPVMAPFSGRAYFRSDLRPLETTYGHYVEIVDETGRWLVRLAHLQDALFGERFVRTGDLIGHSGSSGVPSAHLHLELLVREGSQWVRPELNSLVTLFGIPRQQLVEGAFVGRNDCPAPLGLSGAVRAAVTDVPLSEFVDLLVTLTNQSPDPVHIDLLQVSLYSAQGDGLLAEAAGDWVIAGGTAAEVSVPARPLSGGSWFVGRVSWNSDQGAAGVPARGQFEVGEAPLQLLGFAGPSSVPLVGERTAMTMWVENASDASIVVEDLVLEGLRPDGARWQALSGGPTTLLPAQVEQFVVVSEAPLQMVGQWSIRTLSYVYEGARLVFARLEGEMDVYGPQLEVSAFSLYSSEEMALVLMQVQNAGTEVASVDALEVWGWKPNGESFSARLTEVAPIQAGQSALVQIAVPIDAVEGTWRFVEAGSWLRGVYRSMALPGQPALAVSAGTSLADDAGLPGRLASVSHSVR
ncbi:MAG: M23 family metallopeptidase, partial [Anaerolineae bacterium]